MSDPEMKLIYSEEEIHRQVERLAEEINKDYEGQELLIICVLKGGVIFLSDLVRHLTIPVRIDFVQLASYGEGTESQGVVEFRKGFDSPINGKDVLIVEDIVDSGYSMEFLSQKLMSHNPKSLKACVLLDKKARRKVPFEPDYVGISVEDIFLLGYGLDLNEMYRNLPGIYSKD
ncbi:MAG: hypoxanthine phosphoribosyltransferase [Deltaproteobacteria bacterium]|nr:hypoxanthine phosphoribosyltransferase [Deltaproteobacteria bacterium]